ncbi:MAG TPA: ATPase [Clostridium sp.]|jgi:cell division septum initiation protein DivIVA|nr:ATPase [Clostridia bacterium]HCW05024.1 ATPase [Clostridium sp.]
MDVIQLLEYLQEIIENAPKMPITGKVFIDKNEVLDIIDQIVNYLPDEFKKAQWVLSEKERILNEANKEYDAIKKETMEMMKKQVENHDITKEATAKAQELISLAQRDAKTIRLGARDYADEILCQLDKELELKVQQMVQALKVDVDQFIQNVVGEISSTSNDIRENVKELRNMK